MGRGPARAPPGANSHSEEGDPWTRSGFRATRRAFRTRSTPRAYASLAELYAEASARFRDLPAFSSLGATLTYAEVDRLSRDFAAYLQQRCGLAKGDRLAIMLPNVLQYPVALFGAFRAGLTVVNCNPLYTGRELEHQLKDSGAKAIVVLENFAHTVQEVVARTPVEHVITTEIGDLFPPLKRLLTNLVVKYGKKLVPPWRIEGAVAWHTRARRRARPAARSGPADAGGHRVPAVHGRHDRRAQGNDAHARQHGRQHRAGVGLDRFRSSRQAPRSS